MPRPHRLGAEQLERERRVAVVVRPRKGDDRDPRAVVHASPSSSIVNDSISGLARRSRHGRKRRLGLGSAVGVELDVDEPADTRARDVVTERPQGVAHGLALRIENAFLGTDQHGRLHRTTFGSER